MDGAAGKRVTEQCLDPSFSGAQGQIKLEVISWCILRGTEEKEE